MNFQTPCLEEPDLLLIQLLGQQVTDELVQLCGILGLADEQHLKQPIVHGYLAGKGAAVTGNGEGIGHRAKEKAVLKDGVFRFNLHIEAAEFAQFPHSFK